ncbi:delta-60 repeat domain-containing protein, partial [Dolichospermum circinale CS-545/17]|nr:delta-60 repeat domain-containing protein [Dolichospermum circinale CS-545/17]
MRHTFGIKITLALAILFVVVPQVAKADSHHDLDETFGQRGIFKISIAGKEIFVADAVAQSDGKIVVAMKVSDKTDSGSTALIRLNANGTLDERFGKGGIASISHSHPNKIAILPNGRIVVVGAKYTRYTDKTVVVSLFSSDGTVDTEFSDHGTSRGLSKYWSGIDAIAVQANGKIILGGHIDIPESQAKNGSIQSFARPHFLLARIGSDGKLDSTFGQNGIVVTRVGETASVNAISSQQNGTIVAAGISNDGAKENIVVSRYS